MGFVWNVLLSFDDEEFWEEGQDEAGETCEALERINAWIPSGQLVRLTGPTYDEGAGYGIDANLYGGGFKNFDIEGFIDIVKAQLWKARPNVQLWIKGVEEGMGADPFQLVDLEGEPTAGRKAAITRRRRKAAAKAAKTRKQRAAGRKAAITRKRRAAGAKAVKTKRRKVAARRVANTQGAVAAITGAR